MFIPSLLYILLTSLYRSSELIIRYITLFAIKIDVTYLPSIQNTYQQGFNILALVYVL